ncbi:carboxypeptidase-like regulatory domain-containing protein [Psychroserpens sp. S379A]|uniref:carboxypeptidase-like regulatory domain-containing protein n=1 Tax=Psychroserpens sp. S379A TaxID=3415137 RepID=UPI003C7A936D
MKAYFFTFCSFLSIFLIQAQEFTATILDSSNNKPIPFVAVQTAKYKGVISNEEGVFVIDLEDVSNNQLTISCLGYNSLTIYINDIISSKNVILLQPAINELETVYLSNSKPNVDSIISRVKRNLKANYKSDSLSYTFFQRSTSYFDFDELDIDVKKASHFKKRQLAKANKQLSEMANNIKTSNAVVFQDISGHLNAIRKDSTKLEVLKATQIINSKKDFSLEKIQERAYNVILKYLDTTKTFKLKTGLFKIEDSLSLSDNEEKEPKKEFNTINLKSSVTSVLSKSQLGKRSMLQKILNTDNYEYSLTNVITNDDDILYLIHFEPKRSKAHFTGNIYVSEDSHAILKLDYKYAKGKRGEKLNLRLVLGIKYVENVNQGTIIYKKSENGFYEPRYIKSESGEYFYLNRPLKFIENSENRNKTSFNIKIEGSTVNREELLFTEVKHIDLDVFKNLQEPKSIPYELLRKYDANKWTGQETIAPSVELKSFEAND